MTPTVLSGALSSDSEVESISPSSGGLHEATAILIDRATLPPSESANRPRPTFEQNVAFAELRQSLEKEDLELDVLPP